MSTKTSIKRIALVAVSALGFGLLSVVPARAVEQATTAIGGLTVTQNGNREGIQSALYVKAIPNKDTEDDHTVIINAVVVSKPAGSDFTLNDDGFFDELNGSPLTMTGAGASSVSGTAEILWTPDQAGTYRIVVWHDAANAGDRNVGEKSTTVVVEVVSQDSPITATVTALNTTSIDGGDFGAAMTVAIKNSKGTATRLGAFESFDVSATKDAVIDASTDAAGTPTAQAAPDVTNLTQGNFSKGVAYLNLTRSEGDAASSVFTLQGETATASAGIRRTLTVNFKAEPAAKISDGCTLDNNADGAYVNDADDLVNENTVNVKSRTLGTADFVCATDAADDAYQAVTVEDTGLVSVLGASDWGYDLAVVVADDEIAFSVSMAGISGALEGANINELSISTNVAGTETWEITPADADPTSLDTIDGITSYRVLDSASLTFVLDMTDQFGGGIANETVDVTVAGRNSKSAVLVTDAAGRITYTYTDTVGSAGIGQDLVTFAGPSTADADIAIAYVSTLGIETVTLAYPGEDDTVAGTTSTDISAAAGGATGSSASIVATIKDVNGSVLTGVPVTFAVSGLTGAEVHTNTATVITNSEGKATGKISSYAAGKATVTVTSGGKSATADIYFKQETDTDARTITATASNGIVTATVKDRYGNPIKDVTVKATRSGTGFFGSGSSSAEGDTDKNGVVDFYFNGSGTVTVGFDGDEFGQSADAAGKVGTTAVTASAAGTALVAQKGLGASLAPAGVNSVTLSVEGTSAAQTSADAAADAAAEAIDAANAATDAANLAAEAADAATVAAEEARDAADAATAAVEELATQVATLMAALKAQITTLANTVAKIAKKVKA